MVSRANYVAIYIFIRFCALKCSASDSHVLESEDAFDSYSCNQGVCPFGDVWRLCSPVLREIYNATSRFQRCALMSSLTWDMCEACVEQYGRAMTLISYVRTGGTHHELDECRKQFFSSAKFSAVYETFTHITDFWEKPSCDNCFSKPVTDNSTYELSEDTVKFNDLLNVTLTCINVTSVAHPANTSDVCIACRGVYDDLNKFYDSLVRKSHDGGICFDTVAAMNQTRFLWGSKACTERRYNNLPLYITAGFFTLLAILYYVCAYLLVNPRNTLLIQRKLFQRKRTISSAAQSTAAKRRSTFYDNPSPNPHSINS